MSDWLDADQQISDSLRREMQMEIGERYESRRNRAVWEYRVNPSQTIALADQFHLSDICDLTSFIYDHFGAGEETRQSQQLHRSIFAIVGLPTFFDTTEDIVGSIELLLETMYGNEFVMMNNIYPPDELELGYY
jgi:hypothetical protein